MARARGPPKRGQGRCAPWGTSGCSICPLYSAWPGPVPIPCIIRSVDRQDGAPQAALARAPYELWFGFAASLVPHVLAAVLGGYGRIITIMSVAATVSVFDLAAVQVAGVQLSYVRTAGLGAHWR